MVTRRGWRLPLVMAAGLLAAACTGTAPPPCPPVSILSDASEITTFGQGRGQDLTDVAFRGSIEQVGRVCDYNRAGDTVTSTTGIRLVATRGPAAQSNQTTLIFFVAVVDREQTILARERFESTLSFQANQRQAGVVEEIEQVIPIRPDLRGLDYEILVGFELSPEQLEYNRQEKQRRTGLQRLPGR